MAAPYESTGRLRRTERARRSGELERGEHRNLGGPDAAEWFEDFGYIGAS